MISMPAPTTRARISPNLTSNSLEPILHTRRRYRTKSMFSRLAKRKKYQPNAIGAARTKTLINTVKYATRACRSSIQLMPVPNLVNHRGLRRAAIGRPPPL
jgi:hypothetical protein